MDIFEQLLKELGNHLGTPLHPDANHSCLIKFYDTISVQIELDHSQEFLIIGANLGELLPGTFRESFLREALKSNGEPYPQIGTFAYVKQKNSLVLFQRFQVQFLNATSLYDFLLRFVEKVKIWKEAMQEGRPPLRHVSAVSSGMFGLRGPP